MPNRNPAEMAAFLEKQVAGAEAGKEEVEEEAMKEGEEEEREEEEDTENLLSENNIMGLGEMPIIFKSFNNITNIACNYKKFVAAIIKNSCDDPIKRHLILHVQSMLLSYCLNSVYSTKAETDTARISLDVAKNFFGNIENIEILKTHNFSTDEKYNTLLREDNKHAFGIYGWGWCGFFPKLSGGDNPAKTSLINLTTGLLSVNNPTPPAPPAPPPAPPVPPASSGGNHQGESGEGLGPTSSLDRPDRDGSLLQAEESQEANKLQEAKKASGGSKRKSKKTKRRKIKRRRHTKKKRVKRRKYSLKK